MIYYLVIIIFMSVIDSLLAFVFPFDSSYIIMSFIPQLGFMCLVLFARKLNFRSVVFLAIFLGIIQDVYLNQTLLLYTVLNVVIIFIAFFWSQSVSDSKIENILLMISSLFIKEIIIYLLMYTFNLTSLDLLNWFLKREFLTLIINSFLSIFVLKCVDLVLMHIETKDQVRRKGENISWLKLNLKEEKHR